ncbi:hypothetical protein [Gordonia caeni]|uniref:hypothetical protein n=1 Tax=Gordonia caeni TaxID=1007097 RepID=UPI0031D3C743
MTVREPDHPGDPSEVPDLPTLLGLRSPLVGFSIAVLAVAYVVTVIGTSGPMTGIAWAGQALAFVLALACIHTVVAIPADPLPRWAAVVIGGASLAALGIAWWLAPAGSQWWVQVTAPPAMTAVVAGVFALRGRAGLAWLMVLGTMGVAAAWALAHGENIGLMMMMSNRVLSTVLPATIIALMVRPMLQLMGALRDRELAAVRFAAASRATADERNERLDAFAGEVRPILERIAAGQEFSEDEAMRARLLESTLRDEVRGRGWDSEGVRLAAAAARSRGVAVQLFDDGGVDLDQLTAIDAERLRGELIRVLTAIPAGAVTARILPPGRDHIAVINAVGDDVRRRRVYRPGPTGPRWYDDAAPTT